MRGKPSWSPGESGRERGWDRPFESADLEKTVPEVGVGGACRCQLARLTQVPQIRAWRSLGDIGGSPPTVRSTPGSRDPRPGDRGAVAAGAQGAGDAGTRPRGLRGARRAGGRAERAHGSGQVPGRRRLTQKFALNSAPVMAGARRRGRAERSCWQAPGDRTVAARCPAAGLGSRPAARRPPRVLNHAR